MTAWCRSRSRSRSSITSRTRASCCSTIAATGRPSKSPKNGPRRFSRFCRAIEQNGLEEDAEVLVEKHVGVEHDRAPRHLPRAVHLAQHILAAAGKKLGIRLQMRAVHQKRGPGLSFAVLPWRRFEIADQVTGARRRILGPGHPGVEPRDAHFERSEEHTS